MSIPVQPASQLSTLERAFLRAWELVHGLTLRPVMQFKFAAPERLWRADFAWPDQKLLVEVDGGGFGRVVVCGRCKRPVYRTLKSGRRMPIREGGGHNTAEGLRADHEKSNWAIIHGWRVLRYTTKDLEERPIQIAEEIGKLLLGEKAQKGLFA